MDNRSIVMLNRGQLQPHPDNPRKDLGDLTELRESIRENGIMQNLTVVPCGDGLVDSGDYMILIGHRRFAASDGILDELPCVIADNLSRKEQVGIMLEENMQRSDLTYMEQARGFQMMLDLGDTVESISKKTGFSTKTIKHRLEIAKLDNESIEEAESMFQISISDFIELEKVKDIDKRNEILESVDSSVELYAAVKDYIEDVQVNDNFEYYKKIFLEAGWIHEDKNQWFYYQDGFKPTDTKLDRIRLDEKELLPEEEVKKLVEKIKGEVHFGVSYKTLMVRKFRKPRESKSQDAAEKAKKEKENRIKKNRKALREIRAQICDAYLDFILESDFSFDDPQNELSTLYVLMDLGREKGMSITLYNLGGDKRYLFGQKVSAKGYNNTAVNPCEDFDNWTPLFQLLTNFWWSFAEGYSDFSDNYSGEPKKEILEAHKTFMDILKDMGFHIREEWKPVLDGTSELYEKGGK